MLDEPVVDPEVLRRARKDAGLSQARVARELGLAGGEVVYNWERGLYEPREPALPLLARLFNVEVADLLIAGAMDLRRRRLLAGCTVTQAAETAGVSTVTYRRWEAGQTRRPLKSTVVEALAQLFGVSGSAVEAAFRESTRAIPGP